MVLGKLRAGKAESSGVKRQNEIRVLNLLQQRGPLSPRQIGEATGLSRGTVASVVARLRTDGAVVEADLAEAGSRKGRPAKPVGLNESACGAVAIDLGAGHVRVVVADLGLSLRALRYCSFPVGSDPKGALRSAATMVHEALEEAGVDRSWVMGIGLALPGPFDRLKDAVGSTGFLTEWTADFHPRSELEDLLGLPVEADNDANLSALAETLRGGAAEGCKDIIYVKVSTGLGCGFMLDGRLHRGVKGTAGELAHVVVDQAGPVCYCGKRGCLHELIGGRSIVMMLQTSPALTERRLSVGTSDNEVSSLPGAHVSFDDDLALLIERATAGDAACKRVLVDTSWQLGVAVGNLCNLLDPDRVVLGGVLSRAGTLVLEPLRESIARDTNWLSAEGVPVVAGHWQDWAEVGGALALVLRGDNEAFSERLLFRLTSTEHSAANETDPGAEG
jgi:predicted NBD/HSP70 family sugar kinase